MGFFTRADVIITGIFTALLIAGILASGCTSTSPGGGSLPTMPTTIPAVTLSGSSCGLTPCHGLDLACSPNPPQECSMVYELGDKCRVYARCDTSGGSCRLVENATFDACKACVEQCASNAGSNGPAAFACEAKC
ncbi:MAG: hypothetical protein WCE65_02005 [Methanoregula sp.]